MTQKNKFRLAAGCLALLLGAGALFLATREQRIEAQDAAATPQQRSESTETSGPAADGAIARAQQETLQTRAPAADIPEPVRAMLQRFFAAMQEARVLEAFSALLEGSRIGTQPEDVAMLQENGKRAIAEFGPIRGFELLDCKVASGSLLRLTYLSVGRDYPLRWRFYFYQGESGDKGWRLLDLRVDDQLASMFDSDEENAEPGDDGNTPSTDAADILRGSSEMAPGLPDQE